LRFAASITARTDAQQAMAELLAPIESRMTPGMADLALLFFTGHYDEHLDDIVERVQSFLPNAVLIGCSAEGTIGVDEEYERQPSMSLLAASLPDVLVRPFHIRQGQLESTRDLNDWERLVGVSPESNPVFVALADPFRIPVHTLLDGINDVFPSAPLLGGIASAANRPEENTLIVSGEIKREGVVGVALTGNLRVDTVVSQGCRPIGKPFIITRAERNIIRELGGKPTLERLHDVVTSLSPEDEQLARQSLFIGRVINEFKETFVRGDFLIHNIIGIDRSSGALGIAGHARVGATVQFHVRDADSADEDLRMMLEPYSKAGIEGAMLFSCNGRGTHMWPEPGHDIGVLREYLGSVPVAGFFCGGEFGPVGGRNFVHGFTASIALFQPGNSPI
jgi:small ligand-binding sensory domain FIST